jgi:hypothetical protein
MFEKAGCGETVKPPARRGPDGMAKAELPELKRPNRNAPGRERRMKPDAARDASQCIAGMRSRIMPSVMIGNTLLGGWIAYSNLKDAE